MTESIKIAPKRKTKRRHRWAFPLGLAIIFLALVGTITLVSVGVKEIKKLTDNSALKTEYEMYLKPVAEVDPDSFDALTEANMSQLLDCSILQLINIRKDGQGSPDDYKSVDLDGESTGLDVPQEDIDYYFEYLFGKEIKPDHSVFEDKSFGFVYNSATMHYIIPMSADLGIYMPKVFEIDKKGDSIILTVGYYPNNSSFSDNQISYDISNADKLKKITLRVTDGKPGYYISAIQDTNPQDYVTDDNKQRIKKPSVDKNTTIKETTGIEKSSAANKTTILNNTTVLSTTTKSSAP